ncbi:MAG: ABC transporter substrate-binding protein [Pararhodobacter sp.]|nr:ABC transporter substrate-binding protein [Pararhodobacter sp.]
MSRVPGLSAIVMGAAMLVVPLGTTGAANAQTLRAAPHANLEFLDPIWTTAYITRSHGYLVYDTLFGMDENFEPQPQMVSEWSVSEDGLLWSFTLRPELRWHDGTDVTAADSVASLQRWAARDGVGQALFELVEEITAEDATTFTIQLSHPFPRMLHALGKMSSNVPFIMPARIAATPASQPVTDPTGSGPFIFALDEWDPARRAVYIRNDDYVPREEPTSLTAGAKIPFMERIEFVFFDTHEEAVAATLAGDIHFFESPSTTVTDRFADQDVAILEVTDPSGNVGMAVFNHLAAPFDDPDIRRAVLMAMSQEDYMRAALGNADYWQTCRSIYPCGTPYSVEGSASGFMGGDVEAARQMLADAGYDGTAVVIMDPVDSPVISAFTGVTLALFEELGINVDHQPMPWTELVERRVIRTAEVGEVWNMFHTWWIADDLSDPLRIAFSGNPETGWIGWPDAPELAVLRRSFLLAESNEAAAQAAQQVQDVILDGAHFAILGQFFEPIAFNAAIMGLQRPIQMYYNLAMPPAE